MGKGVILGYQGEVVLKKMIIVLLFLRSAIMSCGAGLLRIRGNDVRSALMCFEFGVLKLGKILNSPF